MPITTQDPFRGTHIFGQVRVRIATYTGVASYVAGGESLNNASGGSKVATLGKIEKVLDGFIKGASGLISVVWNPTTGKLMCFNPGPPSGIVAYVPGGADIKGSANTDILGAGGAVPTNGNLISTSAAANNTTPFTIAANPDCARNICVGFQNNTGGASAGNAVNLTIVGTFRGAAQTEILAFSGADLATIANTSWGFKYGSKPFDTITSITPDAAQPANWNHDAGIGSKLGLPSNLLTPAEADVVKITKNAADLAVTGLVDTTNMTVNLGTLANGDDVAIEYKSAGGEVLAGTDLSSFSGDLVFLGK